MNLKNKHVLITGGNRGMGLSFAQDAAKLGAKLHLPVRSPVTELKEELLKLGAPEVNIYPLDLSNSNDIENFVETLTQPIDVLINNAGLLTGGLLEEQKPKDIQQMLNVNLGALIHLTRLILPEMIKRGKGKIVNNASVSGVMFMPCASTYAASKAGVVAFTRSLEQELKDTGVSTLLLFTPGVKTDMYDQIYDDYSGHLDLSFLTSISSEAWSKIVFKAIENDHSECLPTSLRNRVGLWLAQHFRPAFNKVIANGFKR